VTLRLKLVVAISSLAAFATIVVGATTYRTTEEQLDAEVDRSLQQALASIEARIIQGVPSRYEELVPRSSPSRPRTFERIVLQVIDDDGTAVATSADDPLPVDAVDERIAVNARSAEVTRTVTIDGEPYRVLTSPIGNGFALQLARSTEEVERVLDSIRTRTLVSVLIVVAGGTVAGWLVAQRDAPPGAPDPDGGGGRAHRSPRRSHARGRSRRGGPPQWRHRRHARRPATLAGVPDPAGAGRRPRAAHPADEPAHQHLALAARR
jgi:hypothetical protein